MATWKKVLLVGDPPGEHNHDSDYVELSGDTMTGNLIVDTKIGIGTGVSAPSEKLEVKGNVFINDGGLDLDANQVITGQKHVNSGTAFTYLNMYNGNDGSINLGSSHSLGYVSFNVGSGSFPERMRIANTGYVGIGETSPTHALEVKGHLAITDGYNLFMKRDGSSLRFTADGKVGGTNNGEMWMSSDTVMNWSIGGTSRMNLTQNGISTNAVYVGHVIAGGGGDLNVTSSGTNLNIGADYDSTGGQVHIYPTGLWSGGAITTTFHKDYTHFIKPVGIGTNSPTHPLEIHEAGSMGWFDHDYTGFVTQNAGESPRNAFLRSRGSNASPSVITSGDILGERWYYGYSSGNYFKSSAAIQVGSEGTIAQHSVPSYFSFLTTKDGETTQVERLRIGNNGDLYLNGNAASKAGIGFINNNIYGTDIWCNNAVRFKIENYGGLWSFRSNQGYGPSMASTISSDTTAVFRTRGQAINTGMGGGLGEVDLITAGASRLTASDTGVDIPVLHRQDHVSNTLPQPYYKFDGVDDYINVGSIPIDEEPFSIFCWISIDGVSAGNKFMFGNASNFSQAFGLYSTGSTYKLRFECGGTGTQVNGSETIPHDNTWHFVGVTLQEDGTLQFYVDGVASGGTSSYDKAYTATSNYYIGQDRNGADSFFKGLISGLSVYNTAISASDIQTLYAGGAVPYKHKDVGLYPDISINGDFASNITGWNIRNGAGTNPTLSHDSGVGHTTNGSCKVEVASNGATSGIQTGSPFLATETGKAYYLSAWIYHAYGSTKQFYVGFYDQLAWQYVAQFADVPTGVWTQLSGVFTVAKTHSQQSIAVLSGNAGVAHTYWIDDVVMHRVGAVAEYDGSGATDATWYDKSGNDLDGTITGGVILENKAPSADLVLDQSKKLGWGNQTVYLTGTEANGVDFYHSSAQTARLSTAGLVVYDGIKLPATKSISFDGGDHTFIKEATANELKIQVGGGNVLYLKSDKVGINNETPSAPLHLSGGTSASGTTSLMIEDHRSGDDSITAGGYIAFHTNHISASKQLGYIAYSQAGNSHGAVEFNIKGTLSGVGSKTLVRNKDNGVWYFYNNYTEDLALTIKDSKLAIGHDSPSKPLHIKSTDTNPLLLENTTTDASGGPILNKISFKHKATLDTSYEHGSIGYYAGETWDNTKFSQTIMNGGNSGQVIAENERGNTWKWYTGGTERMQLTSIGRLDIFCDGSHWPLGLYSYGGSSSRIFMNATKGTRAVPLDIGAADFQLGAIEFMGRQSNGNRLAASMRAFTASVWNANDYPGYLTFNTVADGGYDEFERMRITEVGGQASVAIGDYSGTKKNLNVYGSLGIQMNSTNENSAMVLSAEGNWGADDDGDGGLQFNVYDKTGGGKIQHTMRRVKTAANGDTVGDYPYEWWASNADGGLNFRMKLNRNGLGLGTQNPRHKLECTGSGHFAGNVIVGDSYGAKGIFGANADLNSDPGFMCFSASNVNTSNSAYIKVASGNTGDNATKGHIDLVAGYYSGSNMTGNIRFWTGANGNQQRMIVDDSGQVGVGTTSPAARFHVSSVANEVAFKVWSSMGSGQSTPLADISSYDTGFGHNLLNMQQKGTGKGILLSNENASGGIALDIFQNSTSQPAINIDQNGISGDGIKISKDGTQRSINIDHNMNIATGITSDGIFVDYDKTVATTAGTANMTGVNIAVGDAQSSSAGTTVNTVGLKVHMDIAGGTKSGTHNNYAAIFTGGNVGIGDTSPSYPLEVTGDAKVSGSMYANEFYGLASTSTFASGGSLELRTNNNGSEKIEYRARGDADGSGGYHRWTTGGQSGGSEPEQMRLTALGNLGIGTSSPTTQLQLKGNLVKALTGDVAVTNGQKAVVGSGTAFLAEVPKGSSIKIGTETFTVLSVSSDTALDLDSNYQGSSTLSNIPAYTDYDFLSLKTNDGSEVLSIDNAGNTIFNGTNGNNVKIGTDITTAARGFLDVKGAGHGQGFYVTAGAVGLPTDIAHSQGAGTFDIQVSNYRLGRTGGGDISIYPKYSGNDIKIGTDTYQGKLWIDDTNGRVHIGTANTVDDATETSFEITTTTNSIHQFGQSYTNYRSEAAGITLGRHGGTNTSRAIIAATGAGSGTKLGALNFKAYSTGGGAPTFHHSASIECYTDANFATNSAPGALVFKTHKDWATSSSGVTEWMRISSAGNVGIGVTDPKKKLHVDGQSLIEGGLALGSATHNGLNADTLDVWCDLYMRTTAGAGVGIWDVSQGNVGIGTTQPHADSMLDIVHAASAGGDPTHVGTIRLHQFNLSGTGTKGGIEFLTSGSGAGYGAKIYSNAGSDSFGIATRSGSATWTERLKIAGSTGYISTTSHVGIGTANPNYPLELANATGAELSLKRDDGQITDTEDIGTIYFTGHDSGGATTSNIGAKIRAVSTGTWDTNAGGGGDIHDAPTDLKFYTQSDGGVNGLYSPRMTIDSDGYVMIGAGSPSHKLHVVNTSNTVAKFENTVGDSIVLMKGAGTSLLQLSRDATDQESGVEFLTGTTAKWAIGMDNDATEKFHIGTSAFGSKYMTVATNGSVGISEVAPKATLHVTGESVIHENGELDGEEESVQIIEYVARNQTINDTPTECFLNGSSTRLTVPDDATWFFSVRIVARRVNGQREDAGYHYEGVIENNGGTTALVGAVNRITEIEDVSAWFCNITADDTNDSLKIGIVGEASKDINWVAYARIVQTKG